MDQVKIGKFIAQKRKEKGYTQQQLAVLLGVTHKTISRWETAKYMPDISMLIPLSEALDISVIELLKGAEIKEEYNENEIVQSIIDYTKIKPNRIKYDFWSKFIICLVCIITLFVGIDYIKYKPHQWYNGDVSQWQEDFIGDAYEMAFSMKTNRVVFKYPFKALTQIKIECKDAIEYIQKEYHQLPLSKYNYAIYGNMGNQLTGVGKDIREQGVRLSYFIDIFENSFE